MAPKVPTTAILYSAIAEGLNILARYSFDSTGNLEELADTILEPLTVEEAPPRMTYHHGSYYTHIAIADGITHLCITDHTYNRELAFQFLEEIQEHFKIAYPLAPRAVMSHIWSVSFSVLLGQVMGRYNNPPPTQDKVATRRARVEAVQDQLRFNIEEVVSQYDSLENLAERPLLQGDAGRLCNCCPDRKACRIWLMLIAGLLLALYFFSAAICGFSWEECIP